ncbi:hypothetical protein AAHK20_13985 [Trinickia sp. YCB016]
MARPMSIELVNEYGAHAVRVSVDNRSVLLEADEVDAMIEHLSFIRASMRPEVPKVPSRTHQYVIEMDPCWHAERNPLFDGAVLFMRHTGLGWAGFAIPQESLLKLNEVLANHAKASMEAAEREHAPMLPN